MRKQRLRLISLTLVLLVGCGKYQVHQGAVPTAASFDSTTADALFAAQNTLEGLSAHVADYPKALGVINEAREYYNVFKNDYLLWRCTTGITKTLGASNTPCPVGVVMTQAQVVSDQSKTNTAVQVAQNAATGGK